jgi:hypothetical protein
LIILEAKWSGEIYRSFAAFSPFIFARSHNGDEVVGSELQAITNEFKLLWLKCKRTYIISIHDAYLLNAAAVFTSDL